MLSFVAENSKVKYKRHQEVRCMCVFGEMVFSAAK